MLKILNCCQKVNYISRGISVSKVVLDEEKSQKRKVKETVELVTLVDQNDKILGLKTKVESVKLAKKLNLVLERVNDIKYGKIYPAYKMFSTSDILQEEKKTSTAKTLKKLPLNCRISENDLAMKIKIIKKWVAKNCEVHVAVTGNNNSSALMKSVFSSIHDQLKDECRVLNIRTKETSIKCIILPPKETTNKVALNSENQVVNSDEDK